MPVAILQPGSPRKPGEGPSLDIVRRPPCVRAQIAILKLNEYDVRLPVLSPS